jgi:predicted secreted protein
MTKNAIGPCIFSLFVCAGCNDPHAPAASAASAADTAVEAAAPSVETVVHAEDDGKTFDVASGSIVTFKLASNAGTGYIWVPTHVDAPVLAQQGDRSNELSSDTPGGPKLDVYRFMAGPAGSSVVEMSLKRPFGSAPAARAIHVTVNVH